MQFLIFNSIMVSHIICQLSTDKNAFQKYNFSQSIFNNSDIRGSNFINNTLLNNQTYNVTTYGSSREGITTTSAPLPCFANIHIDDFNGSHTGSRILHLKWCEDKEDDYLRVHWNCGNIASNRFGSGVTDETLDKKKPIVFEMKVCRAFSRSYLNENIICNQTIYVQRCLPDCTNQILHYKMKSCYHRFKVGNIINNMLLLL